MGRRKPKPFFESIEVTAAGSRGKSIGKAPDGRTILIANAVPGDTVSVQTTRKKRQYYEGTATELLKPSPDRIDPKCVHFGSCGGCKWQHMDYAAQLRHKENEVRNNLIRIGKVALPEVQDILPAPAQYYYRNKMEFSFTDSRWLEEEEIQKGDAIADRRGLGLHKPGMWDKVLDLEECHLQAEPANAIRLSIREYAKKNGLSFFNPRSQEGFLRTMTLRNNREGEFMLILQFFQEEEEKRIGLLEFISKEFPQIKSLFYTINSKGNDTLYDLDLICYRGQDHIIERIGDLEFRITPKSFYQTNSAQTERLYQIVRDFAGLDGTQRVYDLYTGLGTIAQYLADQAKEVIGIEAVPEAIAAARENAGHNGITNTRFFAGDMKQLLTLDFIEAQGRPDVVITDPPRDGMHKDVVACLLDILPERIVYVSCNSATQARDLGLMNEHYAVADMRPVDMFPQTFHVENVVLLERRYGK